MSFVVRNARRLIDSRLPLLYKDSPHLPPLMGTDDDGPTQFAVRAS